MDLRLRTIFNFSPQFRKFYTILKFLSIFLKYLCFYPAKHKKSIQFFRVQVRQKYQVFRVWADKTAKSAFRVNRFLFVDMAFFSSSAQQPTFLEFKFDLAALVQSVALLFFNRKFKKLVTVVSFFVLVASAVATVGPRGAPLTTACVPPFRCTRMRFRSIS